MMFCWDTWFDTDYDSESYDYVGEDSGLDGTGYLTAQKVWKQNKNGGKPIIAVLWRMSPVPWAASP